MSESVDKDQPIAEIAGPNLLYLLQAEPERGVFSAVQLPQEALGAHVAPGLASKCSKDETLSVHVIIAAVPQHLRRCQHGNQARQWCVCPLHITGAPLVQACEQSWFASQNTEKAVEDPLQAISLLRLHHSIASSRTQLKD